MRSVTAATRLDSNQPLTSGRMIRTALDSRFVLVTWYLDESGGDGSKP